MDLYWKRSESTIAETASNNKKRDGSLVKKAIPFLCTVIGLSQ